MGVGSTKIGARSAPSPRSRRHCGYVISGAVPAGRLQSREILSVPNLMPRRKHARLAAVRHQPRSQTPLDDSQWDGTSSHITSIGHDFLNASPRTPTRRTHVMSCLEELGGECGTLRWPRYPRIRTLLQESTSLPIALRWQIVGASVSTDVRTAYGCPGATKLS